MCIVYFFIQYVIQLYIGGKLSLLIYVQVQYCKLPWNKIFVIELIFFPSKLYQEHRGIVAKFSHNLSQFLNNKRI